MYDSDDVDELAPPHSYALCPLPCWASLLSFGIYNQIKCSFVPIVPSIFPEPARTSAYVCEWWIQRPSDAVMTRLQTNTKAHVQKSSCFIVCSRTGLCFQQAISKQRTSKHKILLVVMVMVVVGEFKGKMNILVLKWTSQARKPPRVHRARSWTVRFTQLVICVGLHAFMSYKTKAHTCHVTFTWPSKLFYPAWIIFSAFMAICTQWANTVNIHTVLEVKLPDVYYRMVNGANIHWNETTWMETVLSD